MQTHQVYFRSIILTAVFYFEIWPDFLCCFCVWLPAVLTCSVQFHAASMKKMKKKSSTILTVFHATLSRGQLLTHFWKALLVSLVLSGCNQQPCWSQIAFFLHHVSDCSSSSHLSGLKFWLCLVLKQNTWALQQWQIFQPCGEDLGIIFFVNIIYKFWVFTSGSNYISGSYWAFINTSASHIKTFGVIFRLYQ